MTSAEHQLQSNQKSSSSPSSSSALIDRQQLLDLIQNSDDQSSNSNNNLNQLSLNLSSHQSLTCLPTQEDQTDLLDQLTNPNQIQLLAYFYILLSRLEYCLNQIDTLKTLSQAQRFCELADRNLLHLTSSSDLYAFANHVVSWSSHVGQPQKSIKPLTSLIKSFAPLNVLTPLHNQLLHASLQSRSIESAVELSNLDLDIEPEEYPICYQDNLIYHYLAGTVQALHKNYSRAIYLLTNAVSAPGPAISEIQVDAYKKLILISLLWNSTPPTLPLYTNSQFKSVFKNATNCKPYIEFMGLYEPAQESSQSYMQLLSMTENNLPNFEKDNNSGLVKLCIESLPKKAIQKLMPTYTSMPIASIDNILGHITGGNAATLIQSMIECGELKAAIDSNGTIVDFFEQDESLGNVEETEGVLRQLIEKVQATEESIKETSAKIERDQEFLKRLVQDLKASSSDKQAGSSSDALQSFASTAGRNFGELIEEDLAVDVGMAWDD